MAEEISEEKLPAYAPRFGKVCVLGMGKTGESVARFCQRAIREGNPVVESMVIYAGKRTDKTETAVAPFADDGFEVIFDSEDVEPGFDTCVVSPGIPPHSDFYRNAEAASAQVMSEPEFAYLLSPRNWIAITGTNGKTTTTALTAHLLRSAGMDARAVGNIGTPCLDAAATRGPGEYLVAELSSFQLASTHLFSPRVAMLLNITPDHLSWHGSHEAYVEAKMKVFENLEFDALAIADVCDPEASECAIQLVERGVRLLRIDPTSEVVATDAAGLEDGELVVNLQGRGASHLISVRDLPIKGMHNITNALAAASAAIFCGAAPADVAKGLSTFAPLEHRIEPCGTVAGVTFYNDSKATNTDAVLKCLTAFDDDPVIVLLGGHDKGTDLEDLVAACNERCRTVICFGEARERFLAAFEGSPIEVLSADHLADATDLGLSVAHPGDVVVLSPACSSFDEFDSYEHRGKVFKEHVARLMGGGR